MKRYRFAFVGIGRVADMHYASLQANAERAELVAVCDSRPEAVAQRTKEWGVPGYLDFEELLAGANVDAVCLFLPHHLHAKFVEMAAHQHKPILLEKPLALTLSQAEKIVDDVQKYGITLQVGHNGLFHPAYEQMVDFVRSGRLGKPIFARANSCGWLNFRPWDFRVKKSETGGGCWVDAGGHLVYLLREILGEVDHITGITGRLTRTEMEGEDHALAALRYKSGALAQLFVSYGHKTPGYQNDWPGGFRQWIEIYGDRGAIQYDIAPQPRLKSFSADTPKEWQGWLTVTPAQPAETSFHRQFGHFLDCLDGSAKPRVTATDALETLKVLLAFYEQCKKEGTLV
jgi:UDP-N-acetyl-2-amino-2-deoxyglucuronate dehydrogenase